MIKGYSILNGGVYCSEDDGPQNYLVFQPAFKYFKSIAIGITMSREYKGLPDKNIKLHKNKFYPHMIRLKKDV